MLRRTLLTLIACASLLAPLRALAAPVDDLAAALRLPELLRVLVEEGIGYGADLEAELFPGAGGARWDAAVEAIHDPARMQAQALARLHAELGAQPEEVARMTTFFTTEPGAAIIKLEIAAREAFLDDSAREAAEVALAEMKERGDPRLEQLDRLIAANDLIEQNIAGAMNANLAFYQGMIAGGAVDATLPDGEMMADLWSQEPQIRQDTIDWLLPYMVMAYRPLVDADLDAYIAFSETPEGQRLNRALFAAFDGLFNTLSRDLGLAAAKMLQGQDI
ncbi:MAG: DUF2059 domain-containing protein [Rhodobacterales bacterium]|nr:DUF2059 domain-containing protein [Rhodobacterales bacterium]MDX5499580.1 DUF2059 domain-containing protein [Rhodobacterales bacterium]